MLNEICLYTAPAVGQPYTEFRTRTYNHVTSVVYNVAIISTQSTILRVEKLVVAESTYTPPCRSCYHVPESQ